MLLVLLISSSLDAELLELADIELFRVGCWLYLVLNILVVVLLERPSRPAQLFSLALADALMLAACSTPGAVPERPGQPDHCFGGDQQYVAARAHRAADCRAVSHRHHLSDLLHQLSAILSAANHFVQAGSLGALCFAAALLVQALARRLQLSETSPNVAPLTWQTLKSSMR